MPGIPAPPSASADEKAANALTAAVEILIRQIVLLPVAVLGPPTNAPRPKRTGAGPRAAAGDKWNPGLGGAFGQMLGPLGRLNSSQPDVLPQAVQTFATSVAPNFQPAVSLLSAGLVAASDALWKKFVPALDGLSRLVLSSAMPALRAGAETVWRAAPSDTRPEAPGAPTTTRITGDAGERVAVARTDPARESTLPLFGGDAIDGAGPGRAEPETGSAPSAATRDTLQRLRLGSAPQAGIQGLGSLGSGFQPAAVSTDPFKQQVLQKMDEVLKKLDTRATAAEAETLGKPVGVHGADQDGGTS